MGKYWRPSKLRQYPGHKGPPTSVKSRDEINPTMAKEVFQLFDVSVLSNITLHKKQGDFFDIYCAWNLCFRGKLMMPHPSIVFLMVTFHTSSIFALPDIDECSNSDHVCDVNAKCTHSYGSYNCTCKEGFIGDGQSCQGKLN